MKKNMEHDKETFGPFDRVMRVQSEMQAWTVGVNNRYTFRIFKTFPAGFHTHCRNACVEAEIAEE